MQAKSKHIKSINKISTLTFIIFLTLFSSVSAITYEDKTYFSKRPEGEDLPLEISMQNYVFENNKHILKGLLQATPFAEFSQQSSKLAHYLLMVDSKDSLSVGRSCDIDNRYIKFNETSSTHLTGEISISPKIETFGIYLSYHQPLTALSDKLLLRINFPIVNTRCNPRFNIDNGTQSSTGNKRIEDYFNGEVMFSGYESGTTILRIMQEALAYGKINRKTVTKTSLADINLELNRRLLRTGNFLFNINFFATLPTNSPPTAEWILEPTIGTSGHWALGLGIDGCCTINQYVQFIYDVRYKYLLAANERRILGLKNKSDQKLTLGQYTLFGEIDAPRVTPAANALAQRVKVAPRSRVECLAMLSYNQNGAMLQLGYNLWGKQKDKVRMSNVWNNTQYAFAGSDFLTYIEKILSSNTNIQAQADFDLADSNIDNIISQMYPSGTTGYVTDSQLDYDTASSPAVFSQKIFLALGYNWGNTSQYYLGAGGSVEFPTNNSRLRQLGFWIKCGFLF